MVVPLTTINSLPNEILISILSHFPTLTLLPLTTTSQRIHDLILAILSHRISEAGQLKNHHISLKAFHPSHRAAGHLICQPLQTLTLHSTTQTKHTSSLAGLSNLYTSFRPRKPGAEEIKGREDPVTENIHLESHELFSQLCTRVNLVRTFTRPGFYHSCVNMREGILRVWRDWLTGRAERAQCGEKHEGDLSPNILWVDSKKTISLRVTVVETETFPVGPLLRVGEERDVSYCLFYEELLVKTTRLLLSVERSEELEAADEGNGLVFGDWHG